MKRTHTMRLVSEISSTALNAIFSPFGLTLEEVAVNTPIPGSFWGDSEAGLIRDTLYYRTDTPVHSVFHEACHFICMSAQRRAKLDTNAGGTQDEENAVCYLQIKLAEHLSSIEPTSIDNAVTNNIVIDKTTMMENMDEWGYSFRLGSAKRWFEEDAEDACAWLIEKGLLDQQEKITFMRRE